MVCLRRHTCACGNVNSMKGEECVFSEGLQASAPFLAQVECGEDEEGGASVGGPENFRGLLTAG